MPSARSASDKPGASAAPYQQAKNYDWIDDKLLAFVKAEFGIEDDQEAKEKAWQLSESGSWGEPPTFMDEWK